MLLFSPRVAHQSFTLRVCAAAVACALFSACSSIGLETDKIDYRAARGPQTLDVPPDLSALPADDRYNVPQAASASAGAAVAPNAAAANRAAGSAVVPAASNARIERAGTQRWLAVDMPPEQAYIVLKDFWAGANMGLDRDDPAIGIVETVWAENRANIPQDIIRRALGWLLKPLYESGQRDKFRSRIERTEKNTAEIFISHRGMVEVFTSSSQESTAWQPRPADPELEAEMLQRLLLRFSQGTRNDAAIAAAAAAKASAAQQPQSAELTQLAKGADGKVSALAISEPFDRAWRRVGLALDRGGFTVEDRDRAKGVYFVRYLDPEVEAKQRSSQGLLSRWFGGDAKIQAQQFRVLVAAAGEATQVSVLDQDGKPESSPVGGRILALLNDQLK